MADILIRNVPVPTLDALKERARRHGHSVQVEALELLKLGVQPAGAGLVAWLKTVRPTNADVDADLATVAIREDRDTR